MIIYHQQLCFRSKTEPFSVLAHDAHESFAFFQAVLFFFQKIILYLCFC